MKLLPLTTLSLILASPAFAQTVPLSSLIGTTAGTVAAGNDPRFSGGTTVDSYGAAGDGVTYDDAAFTKAFNALGAYGGTVNVNPAKAYHVHAGFTVPDQVTIRGQLVLPDAGKGTAGGNLSNLSSRLIVDSTSVTVTVDVAGAASGATSIPVTSLVGVTGNAWVDGAGLYRGTVVNSTVSSPPSVNINIPTTAAISPGATLTVHSTGIVLGVNSALERVTVLSAGMAATPVANSAAYQAETTRWSTGGQGVTMAGYASSVRDIEVIGFFQGVLVGPRVGRQSINGLNSHNWNDLALGPTGDLGYVGRVHAWPFFGAYASYTPSAYDAYTGGVGLYVYKGANDTKVFDSFIYGKQTKIWVLDSQRVSLIGADADGSLGLVDNTSTPVISYGILWDGGSIDGACISCQSSGSTDGFRINLVDGAGSPLTYGEFRVTNGKTFSNDTNNYHVVNGGLLLAGSSARGGLPVLADAGTRYLQISDLSANGGTGNAFSIDATAVAYVGKRGGSITGYTDNIGEQIRGGLLNGQGTTFKLGTSSGGPQFNIDAATGGVVNPTTTADVWGTNGGGHFGSKGITYLHSDSASGVKPIAFYLGKTTNIGQWTALGVMETVATGLTATGTTQAGALVIGAKLNVYSTVAAGSGAVLPASIVGQTLNTNFAGLETVVVNRGANALLVYPPTGAAIDGNAANAGVSIAAGVTAKFACASATQWYQTK